MRYWIRDEDKTPQRFPLKTLIQIVVQQLGSLIYEFWVLRARGYGLRICEWDELLDEQDRIQVERELLEELCSGIEEWFYDLDVEVVADDLHVRFGLHDSTAMYIEAPHEFAESIVKSFKLVQEDKSKDAP